MNGNDAFRETAKRAPELAAMLLMAGGFLYYISMRDQQTERVIDRAIEAIESNTRSNAATAELVRRNTVLLDRVENQVEDLERKR